MANGQPQVICCRSESGGKTARAAAAECKGGDEWHCLYFVFRCTLAPLAQRLSAVPDLPPLLSAVDPGRYLGGAGKMRKCALCRYGRGKQKLSTANVFTPASLALAFYFHLQKHCNEHSGHDKYGRKRMFLNKPVCRLLPVW